MTISFWQDLTTYELADLAQDTIAVLPVAAIEQHGPHLPLSTDCDIAEGHLRLLEEKCPDHINLVILPLQQVGKSDEHSSFEGTLSYTAEQLISQWMVLAEAVQRISLKKLIIINAHGGNSEVMNIVCGNVQRQLGLFCVATNWFRFGVPTTVFDSEDIKFDIHGGALETSLMLYYAADKVRNEYVENFESRAEKYQRDYKWLSPYGKVTTGWKAEDLNEKGAIGNAALSSADKGQKIAEHIVDNFIDLLHDVQSVE